MTSARAISTRSYETRITKLLPPAERIEMENAIASNPETHPVVSNTKGVRKARWSRPGMGKRGGIRVIYFYGLKLNAVFFIAAYAKNEKENVSNADKKDIRKIVESLKGT